MTEGNTRVAELVWLSHESSKSNLSQSARLRKHLYGEEKFSGSKEDSADTITSPNQLMATYLLIIICHS